MFMILQNLVWTIAISGMSLVAAAFIYVISQAGKPADDIATRKSTHTSHVIRRWLFGGLLIAFAAGSYATLHQFPIPPQRTPLGIQQVVEVAGMQWAWQIKPDTVPAGQPVEFEVTSRDVNHGFAIYAPDGRIEVQTQAMPGVTNKIVHTFAKPGTYQVMCLEYCGLGHAPMVSRITVVAATER